jgi:hypothetical protein
MMRITWLLLLTGSLFGAPKPNTPADPVGVILDAFRSRPLVALAEGQHWNEQSLAFRLTLIRDPRFAQAVNDIVVEFGDSKYQGVIDRYVAGAEVPYAELRHVWEDTIAPNTVFDMPVYEEFYRAVREVNRGLPKAKRIRVWLGDPPIDWKTAEQSEILALMYQRNRFAADLIRKEVLAKKRRALLLYADGHFFRKGEETVPEWMMVKTKPEEPLVSQIEKTHPGAVFSIATPTSADLSAIQSDIRDWNAPVITLLPGTVLGAALFGPMYELTGPEFNSVRMEQQFDALLYLGPKDSIRFAELPKANCADQLYLEMRYARMARVPWGKYEIEGLKSYCAKAGGQ